MYGGLDFLFFSLKIGESLRRNPPTQFCFTIESTLRRFFNYLHKSDEFHLQNPHLLKLYPPILFLALFEVHLFSSLDTNRTVLIQSLPKNYLRYIRNFAWISSCILTFSSNFFPLYFPFSSKEILKRNLIKHSCHNKQTILRVDSSFPHVLCIHQVRGQPILASSSTFSNIFSAHNF